MNDSKSDIILDNVVQDLFSTIPLIGRSIRSKLLKRAMIQFEKDISTPHFEIMKLLEGTGTLHMAEIGDRLQISRPQMTLLVDNLVKLGFAERQTARTPSPEPHSRRQARRRRGGHRRPGAGQVQDLHGTGE